MNYEENEGVKDLLIKCITGKANDSEYREAYNWIEQSDENRKYFDSLYDIWFAVGMRRTINPAVEQRVWERMRNLMSAENSKTKTFITNNLFKKIIRVAALFIIAFSIGFILRSQFNNNPIAETYTVEASKGAKSGVTLADGTYVLLNAGSRLTYTSRYNQKKREVNLTGEAYFKVAKNRSKPFMVFAGGIVVNALGTAFNVKAYPEDRTVETTLVEGSISINKAGRGTNNQPVLLKPNQHAVYFKTDDELNMRKGNREEIIPSANFNNKPLQSIKGTILLAPKVQPEVYTSWKDKRWIFHSETFGEFVKKMERLYDINIILEDEELGNYKLTGSIEEENIEMVLKALQLIIPIDYKLEHKQLIIKANDSLKYNFDQTLKKNVH